MAPVLSLAPVTYIVISHPVITSLTLLMATTKKKKNEKNEKEMADFPFHDDVSQRAIENQWRRGVMEEGQSVGMVPVCIRFV